MPRLPVSRRAARRGMTLLEILVAGAIGVAIVVAAVGLYTTVIGALRRQAEWRWEWRPAAAALDLLRRDIACAVAPPAAPAPHFVLERVLLGTNALPVLSFYTAVAAPDSSTNHDFSVWRVRYLLEGDPSTPGGASLVRQAEFFGGSSGRVSCPTGALAHHVRSFEVLAEEATAWTNSWDSGVRRQFPRVLRVRLEAQTASRAHTVQSECLVPAGMRIAPPTTLSP